MKAHTAKTPAENRLNRDCGVETGSHAALVPRKTLANRINFNHFQNRPVLCFFEREDGKEPLCLPVRPQPTFGSNLVCLWPEAMTDLPPHTFRLQRMLILDPKSSIAIQPEIRAMSAKGFCVRLPDHGEQLSEPEVGLRSLDEIRARINRENLSVTGRIERISGNTLSLTLDSRKEEGLIRSSGPEPVNIAFINGRKILFTGQYRITGTSDTGQSLSMTLEPASPVIHRFAPKKFRSPRFALSPSPDANFVHPLHGGYVSLNVVDLSGAGFSVENREDQDGLLTGMVVPKLELNFSGAFSITCRAQVVHRNASRNDIGEERIVYGFSFMDMSLDDHLKLSGFLHQRENNHIRVCTAVDENELWSFFFETGFIYAKKYNALVEDSDKIRTTYRKLYTESPSIARHFIYREKGEVVGHLSMLRLYRDAWLIHHHAALKQSGVKAGLAVLNHLAWFCYNSIWLEACHMRYMFCYFRPDNAFPNFFFNGFAERLNDPSGCSTDTFAYLNHRRQSGHTPGLPSGWTLSEASKDDLKQLADFYTRQSGGLMIDALDLSPGFSGAEDLDRAFHEAGLKKKRLMFSLKHKGVLTAVAVVNLTDMAINMSDLSNCLTVFVIDEQKMGKDLWDILVEKLGRLFDRKRFPVLLYPHDYAQNRGIAIQKQYILWILSTKYSDHYFEFLDEVNTLGSTKH